MSDDSRRPSPEPGSARIRLVSVEVTPTSGDDQPRITVRLERRDERATVTRTGDPGRVTHLHTVADATLQGVREFFPVASSFRLMGVERVLAAGMDVALVAVEAAEIAPRPLVGATPIEERDGPEAAASATLDAVNRLLGRPGDESDAG